MPHERNAIQAGDALLLPIDPLQPFAPLTGDEAQALLGAMLRLAAGWVSESGLAIDWLTEDTVRQRCTYNALMDADAGKRAAYRCALNLVWLCERASGRQLAELLGELHAKPLGDSADGP